MDGGVSGTGLHLDVLGGARFDIPRYAAAVKGLQEASIGHALIADALYLGLTRSVKAYLKALGAQPLAAASKRSNSRAKKI